MEDRIQFILLAFGAHEIPFFAYAGLEHLLTKFKIWQHRKILPTKTPPESLVSQSYRKVFVSHFVFQWITLWFAYDLFLNVLHMSPLSSPLPVWTTIAAQFCVFMIVCDTLLYWVHRTVHLPFLYATIHKQHHEYKVTIPVASEYFSLVEEIATGFIPTIAGPALVTYITGMHTGVLLMWIFFRVCESSDAHCGYDLPMCIFQLGRPADRHDFHHSKNMGNFGAFFMFWDYVCGTDKVYWQDKANKSAKKQ